MSCFINNRNVNHYLQLKEPDMLSALGEMQAFSFDVFSTKLEDISAYEHANETIRKTKAV